MSDVFGCDVSRCRCMLVCDKLVDDADDALEDDLLLWDDPDEEYNVGLPH